jgi:hypothetical protein
MKLRSDVDRLRVPGIRREMIHDLAMFPGEPNLGRDLKAGRPVELPAGALPPMVERCRRLGLNPNDLVRVTGDDMITIVVKRPPFPPTIIDDEEP